MCIAVGWDMMVTNLKITYFCYCNLLFLHWCSSTLSIDICVTFFLNGVPVLLINYSRIKWLRFIIFALMFTRTAYYFGKILLSLNPKAIKTWSTSIDNILIYNWCWLKRKYNIYCIVCTLVEIIGHIQQNQMEKNNLILNPMYK